MKKYIIVVRDFNPCHLQPSDDYLRVYGGYYVSPVVELDIDDDYDMALDAFVENYEKNISHFRYYNLELIPAQTHKEVTRNT